MTKEGTDAGISTIEREKVKKKHPKLFKVVLLNDDYTPMEFVVAILESIFRKSPAEAVQIMLQVHKGGKGVCGIFSKQIAEAKVTQVRERARAEGHPLMCLMEEV